MEESLILGGARHIPSPSYRYVREFIPSASHDGAKALIAVWQGYAAGGGMRMGRDIPSRPLAKLLPYLTVTERGPMPSDVRFRLAGSLMAQRFGRDITGVTIAEAFAEDPAAVDFLYEAGKRAFLSGEPVVSSLHAYAGERMLLRIEQVTLPIFASDGVQPLTLSGTFSF